MQKNHLLILFFLLMFLPFFSCKGIYEDAAEMAADYKSLVPSISAEELKAKFEKAETFVLIDVRQTDEFQLGNIPGSVSVPRGVLEFKIGSEDFWALQYMYPPGKDEEIIIYCQSGVRGTLAALSLMQMGYKNVKNLEGGFILYNPEVNQLKTPASSGGCGG